MDSLKTEGNNVKRRRITTAELAEILDRAKKPQENGAVNTSFHLETKKSLTGKTKKYFSKAAALGAPEKILSLIALYPEWGPKKLAESLMLEGISLTHQAIHYFLVKHNLNRRSLRKSWKDNLKETKS